MVSQNKSLIYIGKIHREKGRDRIRLTPIPTEASRRINFEKEVVVVIRTLEPAVLPLPYHIISLMKQKVFRDQISEEDLKWEIGFLAYEYLNVIIHILGLGSIALAHYPVNKLVMEKRKARISRDKEVDVVKIKATGFYLWPHRETTERVRFESELYDLEDHFDYATYSYATYIVDLYNLMKDLKIRWDIDWRY